MISTGKRILILALLFLAVITAGLLAGRVRQTATGAEGTVEAASLPVLYAERGGVKLGPLYGYAHTMDESCYEGVLFPVTGDLSTQFYLADGAGMPESLSYEVRSLTDGRLIQRGTVSEFTGTRRLAGFSVRLQDLLADETVYGMRMEVRIGGRTAYYYAQVKKVDEAKLNEMLAYAVSMHNGLYDRETALPFAAKLEPEDNTDRNTLAYVNIHSGFPQVAWGTSGAVQTSDTFVTIRSFGGNFGHFTFRCLVEAPTGENTSASFRVEEYISLQMFDDVTYLLRYERHTEQIWRLSADNILPSGILLGVQEEDRVEAVTGAGGDVTAFTVAGELYSYTASSQQLTRIFSFQSAGAHALRTLCPDYRIRVMDVDSRGNVDFLISGYFGGGGVREGENGLFFFRYLAEEHRLEERLVLTGHGGARQVSLEADRVLYENGEELLYFLYGGRVCAYDFSSGEVSVLLTEDETASLVVSEDGTTLAWLSGSSADTVRVLNMKTGESASIRAEEGCFLRPLGYIREDLILGSGERNGLMIETGDGVIHPYTRLRILSPSQEELLSYSYPDILIASIRIDSDKVIIRRFTTDGGLGIRALSDDMMLRSESTDTSAESRFSYYQHTDLLRMLLLPLSKMPSFLRIDVRSA